MRIPGALKRCGKTAVDEANVCVTSAADDLDEGVCVHLLPLPSKDSAAHPGSAQQVLQRGVLPVPPSNSSLSEGKLKKTGLRTDPY